jgi:hypothetical protein
VQENALAKNEGSNTNKSRFFCRFTIGVALVCNLDFALYFDVKLHEFNLGKKKRKKMKGTKKRKTKSKGEQEDSLTVSWLVILYNTEPNSSLSCLFSISILNPF